MYFNFNEVLTWIVPKQDNAAKLCKNAVFMMNTDLENRLKQISDLEERTSKDSYCTGSSSSLILPIKFSMAVGGSNSP